MLRKLMNQKCVGFKIALVLTMASSFASAYEMDTHFYATYSMARYAGMKHETAKVVAAAAQWPDETEILGSPLIPELGIGTKMRRLFHFPCPAETIQTGAESGTTLAPKGVVSDILAKISKVLKDTQNTEKYEATVHLVCETETADTNAAAFNMLFEGLQEGSLIKAATSIHTIEDSYAHAGTTSALGHAGIGHIPDRPNTDPDKYERMIKSVMTAMVAIRMNLPESSIDKTYRDARSNASAPNYQLSIDALAKNYIANPFVHKDYQDDMYKSPEFVIRAIDTMLTKAQKTSLDGEFFIDPNFNVTDWVRSQTDILAEVQKGTAATCSVPLSFAQEKQPSYIDCVLMKLIGRLLTVRNEFGNSVVDKFRGSALLRNYPEMNQLAAPYDLQISKLADQRTALAVPSKYNFKNFDKITMATMRSVGEINAEIMRIRQARRLALEAKFQALLDNQSVSAGDSSLRVIRELVSLVTAGFIPRKLDNEHRGQLEFEGPLRIYEAALRVRNVRQTIFELYGDYVRFVESSKIWSYPASRAQVQNLPLFQADVLPLPGEYERRLKNGELDTNIKYITFNYNQIDIWVETMVRYMFPDVTAKLFPADKCTIMAQITKNVNGKDVQMMPALSVSDKKEVFTTFFKLIVSPSDTSCSSPWTEKVSARIIERSVDKIILFLNDFRTTHILYDYHVDWFLKENGIQSLYRLHKKDLNPGKSADNTPLFRKFESWGQLTSAQEQNQKTSLRNRFVAIKSGQPDPTPYVGSKEFKDENH